MDRAAVGKSSGEGSSAKQVYTWSEVLGSPGHTCEGHLASYSCSLKADVWKEQAMLFPAGSCPEVDNPHS